MARRLHPVAAAGFAAGADAYERARPSYPDEAVKWLVERLGLGRGRTVLDVGAGTGKLTRLLVPSGAEVIAVEPIAEMRQKLVEAVADTAQVLDATAEELPVDDDSVDAVTVAQAIHWFDQSRALPEFHRVLRPPQGQLAIVWNSRDLDDDLQRRLEDDVLRPVRDEVPRQMSGTWRTSIDESPLFGPLEVRRFPYAQLFTVEALCERVSSTSFVAALPADEHEALLDRVRGLVTGADEPFAFRYVTEVYVTEAT